MPKNAREVFAKRMRALRLERGWSQDVLADESGLHRAYIGTIERCEKSVTLDTAEKIAKALKVPLKVLFEE